MQVALPDPGSEAQSRTDESIKIPSPPASRWGWLRALLIGKAKDPLAPAVFHRVSLVAFLAWVGLGSDGLSSSCYGPEEAFLALGSHTLLALVLALLVAVSVFVFSTSYGPLLQLFPSGRGGCLVAA